MRTVIMVLGALLFTLPVHERRAVDGRPLRSNYCSGPRRVRSAFPVCGAGCRLSWISATRTHNKKPSANVHNMSRK
jgi:hypothetical protein